MCSFFLRRRGTISCTVTEGRRYSIDLCIALTLTFVYCAQLHTCYYRTVNYCCFMSINFREFNFRSCLALRKYFNNEIFPNYGSCSVLCYYKLHLLTLHMSSYLHLCVHTSTHFTPSIPSPFYTPPFPLPTPPSSHTHNSPSLIPRPFPPPVFDCLQYANTEGEGLGDLITCGDVR